MRYKFELSVMIAAVFGLLLTGVASADSVTKTLYVDGTKVGTSTTTQAISFPYQRLTIGCEGNAWVRYSGLIGQIDEFAVYNRVLTDTEVATHAGAVGSGYADAVNASNPVLYLEFNDVSSSDGSKAKNSVNADTNCTYRGAVTLTGAGSGYKGGTDRAAILSGSDCIDVCDWDAKFSTIDISVEFWVKTTQNSGYPRFFQHNGGNTEEHSYGAMYSAGSSPTAIGLIGGGSTGYLNSTVNDDAWHHVVVTFNSIKPGPYAAEVMVDDPCVYLKFDNQMLVDSSENHWWVGMGTLAQVQKTAGGMGLSLYEDNTKIAGSGHADAEAFTWNNWNGGSYQRTAPPYGGNNTNYAFAPGDISFEIWIKSVSGLTPGTYGMLFQQIGAYTREPNGPALGLYNDANVSKLRVAAGSQWYYPGTVTPMDGQWHQLVVTYDKNDDGLGKSMVVQLYLDGSLAGQSTINDTNGNARLKDELSTLEVGCENDWGYPYNCWSGYVDEFAVYKGVLSADRVAAHYAAWQPKDCADVKARGMTLPGDLNGDCQVDLEDFAILASQWHLCDDPGAGCPANW